FEHRDVPLLYGVEDALGRHHQGEGVGNELFELPARDCEKIPRHVCGDDAHVAWVWSTTVHEARVHRLGTHHAPCLLVHCWTSCWAFHPRSYHYPHGLLKGCKPHAQGRWREHQYSGSSTHTRRHETTHGTTCVSNQHNSTTIVVFCLSSETV